MEHIPALSTKKLKKLRDQNFPLPLGQAAAVRSLTMIGKKYSTETALKVALIVIECMSKEMLSPDAVCMAMYRAKNKKPEEISELDYNAMIGSIQIIIISGSKKNPLSGLF
jgi:hypothetical protein